MVRKLLSDRLLDAHLPRLRAHYRAQAQALYAALTQHLQPLGVCWNQPAEGMFLWLQLPQRMSAQQLLSHALAQGVAFVPGQAFFTAPSEADKACLRLSFSTTPCEHMDKGARRVAAAMVLMLQRAET